MLGDAHRAVSHGRYAGDLARGVRAVVLERMAGQLVLAGVCAAGLFTLPAALLGPGLLAVAASVAVFAVVALVVAIGWVVGRRRGSRWWRALSATVADTYSYCQQQQQRRRRKS